ncbi:MAG: protein kinase [Planctomycetes bacterium]|nr:protein kinase [Planctomycetota bacterium]
MPRQASNEDVLVGRIALASGLLTRDKLDECIHIFESSELPPTLGEVFVERGYLNRDQLANLLSLAGRDLPQSAASPTPLPANSITPVPEALTESAFFGKIAIREKLVSHEQLFECLDEQLRLEKSGKARQIGEIMVEKGYLKLADVSRLLKLQKKVVMKCPNCEATYTVSEELSQKRLPCQRCKAPLVPVRRLVTAASETITATGEVTDSIVGKIFSGVQVLQRVGRGGMATVYKGKHLALNKMMAIKILSVSVKDPDMINRFVKEARSVAKLEHPNIVQVYNVGQKFGFTFILMQFIEGHTIAEILDHKRKIPPGQAIKIVREIARALGHAHRLGIVHRDVKPDNVFITVDGEVRVGDFGLAIETRSTQKTDTITGTPYYMPPEQWRGDPQDGRSDIYSLGVTFYYLVTGRRPFEGSGPVILMEQHMHERPRTPSSHNPDIPSGVSAVIMKMMAKRPDDRYQSAEELLSDLERVESGREPEAPPDASEMLVCRFCQTSNKPKARKCSACGEYLSAHIEMLLMDNEFQCPKCRHAVTTGSRMCEACGMMFCKSCKTAPVAAGTEYCPQHQEPPPQFPQRRQVRKK